jgi:hypothetical protein
MAQQRLLGNDIGRVIQRSGTPGVRVCGRINSCSKAVRWAGVCRRKRSLTSAPSSS